MLNLIFLMKECRGSLRCKNLAELKAVLSLRHEHKNDVTMYRCTNPINKRQSQRHQIASVIYRI